MRTVLAASLLLAAALPGGAQQAVTAEALVEKQQVFVGEPFLCQIRVNGSDSPGKPDVSALADFAVEDLGGQQNSSESVTIIQGRVNRVVERGYVFSYRLTAKRPGELTIPALTVRAGGRALKTQPVGIRAVPPEETGDFKLRLSLSPAEVYVNQPVTMRLTWYVGRKVGNFSIHAPAFDDTRFEFADPEVRPDPNRHIQIPVGGRQLLAEKSQAELEDRDYLTVAITRILIPKAPGSFTLPQATASGQALQGYERSRRGVFDDFFGDDVFGFGRRPVYQNFVTASNRPVLEVRELPAAGRPPGFSGLVGRYRIAAEASPLAVNVGDPITLKLRVTGDGYLGKVELPPLDAQPALARDFRIPPDRAAGVLEADGKSFTQTIRAVHADVTQVPPVELSYFDPEKGAYEITRTVPIPIAVKGTRIVTAGDAEGAGGPVPAGAGIETSEEGIAHNFEGPDILVDEAYGPAAWLRDPVWLAGIVLPPLGYVAIAAWSAWRRRLLGDPHGRRARRAYRELDSRLRGLAPADTDEFYAALLDGLRRYLVARLALPPGAVTFADARPVLERLNAGEEALGSLGHLFERCEAGRYAGSFPGGEDPAALKRSLLEWAAQLEGVLG